MNNPSTNSSKSHAPQEPLLQHLQRRLLGPWFGGLHAPGQVPTGGGPPRRGPAQGASSDDTELWVRTVRAYKQAMRDLASNEPGAIQKARERASELGELKAPR